MKISDLILNLERIRAEEGDLPVYRFDHHSRVDDPGIEIKIVFVDGIFDWQKIFGEKGIEPEPRRVVLR